MVSGHGARTPSCIWPTVQQIGYFIHIRIRAAGPVLFIHMSNFTYPKIYIILGDSLPQLFTKGKDVEIVRRTSGQFASS